MGNGHPIEASRLLGKRIEAAVGYAASIPKRARDLQESAEEEAGDDKHDCAADTGGNLGVGHQLHTVAGTQNLNVAGSQSLCLVSAGSKLCVLNRNAELFFEDSLVLFDDGRYI